MNIENKYLPTYSNLNISAFSSMFNNVSNSYKFYFFLAILENLKENNFNANVSFDNLRIKMFTLAWYPYHTFHLSFGSQDQIAKNISKLGNIEITNFLPDVIEIKNKIKSLSSSY